MQLDFFARLAASFLRSSTGSSVSNCKTQAVADAAEWQADAARWLLQLGCEDLANRITVKWNPRMRSTAGMAFVAEALITLNPRLREFGDSEIERTLRHELAHLLANHRAGRRRIEPHGREWRQACVDLGVGGEHRCHTLPLPKRAMSRRFRYRCEHCGIEVRRVRPLRRATACLVCCRNHNRGFFDERFRFRKVRT